MPSAPAATGAVVLDPIDGSLNAKRGIPFFSLSLAVAEGATMGDVIFGYVYDFGSGEEWTAERGEGAFLNGEPLGALDPKETIEILSFEATTTPIVADRIGPWSASPTACGSWARSRSRSATSRPVASTRVVLAEARALGRHRRRAAARARVRARDRALRGSALRGAPLDLVARSRLAAAGVCTLLERLAVKL